VHRHVRRIGQSEPSWANAQEKSSRSLMLTIGGFAAYAHLLGN
jgi:hypothetical protein